MTTALELISHHVVVGRANERLPDVAAQLARLGTHYLVVLHEATGQFIGLVRLADVAWRANAGTRILGDLVSSVRPVTVHPGESATAVSGLFQLHRLGEIAVIAEDGNYVGLITIESVLAWNCAELRRIQNLLRLEEESLEVIRASLQAATTEKEKYLTKLSHTLRSPLSPVMLLASARAANDKLPEDIRKDFRTIAASAAAEAKMIDELIDAARQSRQSNPPMR